MNQFGNRWNALVRRVGELSPACRQAIRWLSDARERPLSRRQRLGLRAHLALCRWCRRYRAQLDFLRRAAKRSGAEGPESSPARLPSSSRARIKRNLQNKIHDAQP